MIIFLANSVLKTADQVGAVTQLLFSYLTLEFIAGAAAACVFKARRRGLKASKLSFLAIVLLAYGALKIVFNVFSNDPFPTEQLARIDTFLLPAVLIVYGLAAFDWAGHKLWKPLVTLGDWSYSLYLTHVLSLTVMGRLWVNFSGDSILDNVIILFAMVAVTIAVSGLVYHFIEQPMIKAARMMRERLFN